MRITHRAIHRCSGFVEYERIERGNDSRGSYRKYGYRRRLIDNGIYARGETYGHYMIWGSDFADKIASMAIRDAIAEAAKNSMLYKILHGEKDVSEKPPLAPPV